jgi:HPt (histidine-containing phosphotransfer) domain-containing protein
MDDYLTKPVTQDRLAEILARWLGTHQGSETDQSPLTESASDGSAAITGSTWDKAAALKRLEGDKDLLAVMIDLFLEEAPTQLAGLRTAQAQDDLPALSDAAHAIKGSVSYFCAEAVKDRAVRLEHAARGTLSADYRLMTDVLANGAAHLMENMRQSKAD